MNVRINLAPEKKRSSYMNRRARNRMLYTIALVFMAGIFVYIVVSNPESFSNSPGFTVVSVNGNVAAVQSGSTLQVARNPWPDLKVGDLVIVIDDYKAGPSIVKVVGRQ